MREFKASADNAGMRADIFVAKKYPKFTRSSLEELFERKHILVNNQPAKPALRLHSQDLIEVDEQLLKSTPPKIKLPILYEDDQVLVIDKPAGILTHAKGALNLEGTVASFIKSKIKDKSLIGNRAGIVHRLDRDTNGVIITARDSESMRWLQRQFSLRKAKKIYTAVVEGEPEPASAIIDAPIARNPKKPQSFYVSGSGKSAKTQYKVIKTVARAGKLYSVLELRPTTGRTHQLRVHLAYIGHPIVGDRVYGHAGDHMLLHASSLELTLPSRDRKVFSSALPEYIESYLK